MSSSFYSDTLVEQQVLNCIWDNPEYIYRFDRDYFISEIAQDLFYTLKSLYESKVEFSITNIVSEGNKRNNTISKQNIQSLREQEYKLEDFDNFYFKALRKNYAKHRIQNKLLKETLSETSQKGELNTDKIRDLQNEIESSLELIEGKEAILLDPKMISVRYEEVLHARNRGEYKYSFGDSHLDRNLVMGAAPGQITTLFAATGVGKSAYALNLVNRQINKRIPSVYFSLEMDTIATMDRLISMRRRVPTRLFYPEEDTNELNDRAFEILKEETEILSRVQNFFFVEDSSLSLLDIEMLIREAKRKMKSNYLIVTIDLLTMVKDFSGQDPSKYEESMNLLHAIAKRNHVHVLAVVQANRSADSAGVSTIDNLDRLRPSLVHIKNSNAIAERSRLVLGAYRPKYYAERLFPEAPELDTMDDIMEIQLLKQSHGQVGKIVKYLYVGEMFSMYPFFDDSDSE